jgi:hypothetical protein
MWRAGEEVGEEVVAPGEVVWSPANLRDNSLYYWRVRTSDELAVRNPDLREYESWTKTGYFYTDFRGEGGSRAPPVVVTARVADGASHLSTVELVGPAQGETVTSPETYLRVKVPAALDDSLAVVFELDTDPDFGSDFFQGSTDIPAFFEIYWKDLRSTGDGKDDDLDGRKDEEYLNQKDDDGDGYIDEDLRHPIQGEKWPILVFGAVFGLAFYAILGLFGMPIFFIWGFVRAVASAGAATFFTLITEVIGALLAKYYFWPRYGTQQWRQYAMVLAVGFGVGISLVGMVCAALLMVSKAVSPTSF